MNKIFTTIVISSFILLINLQVSIAQNARFSQIFTTPVMLNPALAGRFNGNIRAGILSSWQNSKVASVAHQDAYIDYKLFNKKVNDSSAFNILKEKQYFGINVNYYHYGKDITGFTQSTFPFSGKFVSITGSYHFNLTKDARYYAGVGFQLTNADATVDETSGNQFDSEISGGGFRYKKSTMGDYKGTKGYFDNAVGMYLGYQNEEQLLEMGFSLSHLQKPSNDLTGDPDTKLRSRFCAYSNATFKISPEKLLLFRNCYWEEGLYQGSTTYKDSAYILAFYSGFEVIKTKPVAFAYLNYGLMSRNFQSLIPYVNLFLGKIYNARLSYEVPLNSANHPANNAYRTELFMGVSLGKPDNNITSKNRKNCFW